MKRSLYLFFFCIFCLCSWAQNNPNRLIVVDKSGSYQGFLVERIDSMMFVQVEGRVAAEIDFKGFRSGPTGDTINLAITKTPECWSYQIDVIPTNTMSYLTDEAVLANYIQRQGGPRYTQDFTNAEMTGFDFIFEPKAEYTLVTLGYDRYGVPCSTEQVSFSTPAPEIVGNPYVEAKVLDVTTSSFTISFKPNDDVFSYSVCSFLKGEAEQQFNMWGPMFGFATIEQMVYSFGLQTVEDLTYEWKSMNPNTEYEVLIAMRDIEGNYAELLSVPVKTLAVGGEGLAEVKAEVAESGGNEENGYYQHIIFTPNSDCAVYHAMLVSKDFYDEEGGDEAFAEYLMADTNPFNPWDSYWNLFTTDSGYWNVDPGVTYYAIARAKNLLDEWGPMEKVEFTVTIEAPAKSPKIRMARRQIHTSSEGVNRPTVITPNVMPTKGIQLK